MQRELSKEDIYVISIVLESWIRIECKSHVLFIPLDIIAMIAQFYKNAFLYKWSALHKSERISLTNVCYKATHRDNSNGELYIISDEMVMCATDCNVHCWRLKVLVLNINISKLKSKKFLEFSYFFFVF